MGQYVPVGAWHHHSQGWQLGVLTSSPLPTVDIQHKAY